MNSYTAQERFSLNAANSLLISKMRAILAIATLLVIYIDPSEPQQLVALTYSTLVLYCIYALALFFFSRRKSEAVPVKFTHWIDTGWYLVLIALSSGTSSIFFFLFFFSILTASFRFGFTEGLRVVFASTLMFTLIGFLAAPSGEAFELNRFLLRPVYLSVMGYMIAYWGGRELEHKQRLEILRDINKLYNPRFGIDQTISAIMQKILISFDADSCLMITGEKGDSTYNIRQSYRDNPEKAIYAEQIAAPNPLNSLPEEYAVIYQNINTLWNSGKNYLAFDLLNGKRVEEPIRNGEILADFLETDSFISVPLYQRNAVIGRLYLTSRAKVFDYSDIEFLRQLLDNAVPVVENVNLLDRLASEATEHQRKKISRDIHDSTIQPYIGLKLGLEALQMRQQTGDDITRDIEQLTNMANANINDIRSYINKLKVDAPDPVKGSVLISAIRKQADKLSEFYGIRIEVRADDNIQINDRLSAEVFQLITEGLSNIRRHTKADHALIGIECADKKLKLEIMDNNPDGEIPNGFIPKSIAGRARALGGHARVRRENNITKVSVEIPL
jgi:signal transduction histidine kinase